MLKKILPWLPFFAVLVFLPALTGPLVLDDSIHLDPIRNWLSSQADTAHLIFGNTSGPFGRPISILSFVANLLTTGASVWPMKLTNLLLHLVTGLCLAKLFCRLFMRDATLAAHASKAGIIAASFWLVLPQHISTVFYVIQRMTVLATLFSVLACWAYVVARERMEAGQKQGLALLVGALLFTVLSVLSKESGLLIPLYLLVIELTFFEPAAGQSRPRWISWGFRLGVIYPCMLVAAYLALNPDFVLAPYTDRPFSMPERALTEISVMADYFASTFWPMMRSAGVFNDDFPIAHALSSQEIWMLLAGAGLIVIAIASRKKHPCFAAGIGLFFTGHLLESSIFSLEIYFSHRNYFPSIGLVLAASGLIAGIVRKLPADTAGRLRRLLPILLGCLFLAYAANSFFRALSWSNAGAMFIDAQIHHPTSSRLRSELLLASMYAGQTAQALQQADIAMQTASANEKRGIQLWRMLVYCYQQAPMPDTELQALQTMSADRITLATNTALIYVSAAAEANSCPGLDRQRLGILVRGWAANTIQYPGSPLVWKTHLSAARLLASSGDLAAGYKEAELAFTDSGYQFDPGILAFQLANSLEDREKAQAVMAKLLANQYRYTSLQQSQLQTLRNQ